jgi:thiol-disulfide isomerase/thioredoxin/tetratricopeptide (TPR) repeat protein
MHVFTALLVATLAMASQAPDFTTATLVKNGSTIIVATAPANHHFNLKAPMGLNVITAVNTKAVTHKPKLINKHEVKFEISTTTYSSLNVSLYLCDDANTYCEKHNVTLGQRGAQTALEAQSIAPTPLATAGKYGFIVNDWKKALDLAKTKNKPLIIDFFGIWCPPCNMLDHEVFSSKNFKTASKDFIKLKLDADSEQSWTLKEKYKVGGYPTVIFAAPNGEELSRIVGFRPPSIFINEVKKAWASRNEPYSLLKIKADGGDPVAAKRVGMIHLERREFEAAANYLSKASDARDRYFEAAVSQLQLEAEKDSSKEEALIDLLNRSIAELPKSIGVLQRLQTLAELYENKKNKQLEQQTLNKLLASIKTLASEPEKLIEFDYSLADLYALEAETYEKLDDDSSAKAAWQRAANEFKRRAQTPDDRGNLLELAYCLAKAGNVKASEDIYSRLENKYPNEFTFFYNHSNVVFSIAKEAKRAEPLAERALKFSYGDNKLRAALLLAKIRASLGDKANALKLLQETLNQAIVPTTDPLNRTHRYIKSLKKFTSELEQAS